MWRIAKKDLKIFFTDRRALIISLLLPIGLITLFAMAFGGVGGSDEEEASPIQIIITDLDGSASSKALIAELDSIPGISCLPMDAAAGVDAVKSGEEIAAMQIGKGFNEALMNGSDLPVVLSYDQSRSMEVSILQNLIISRLSAMKGAVDAEKGIDRVMAKTFSNVPPTMQDSVRGELSGNLQSEQKPEQLISMQEVVGDEESNWGLIQAVAGTAIMMLLFSVSAIGKSMLDEKESGVLRRLLQSPLNANAILFGKMLTAVIMAIFQLSVLFIFSWLAFGLNIWHDIPSLLVMILATAFACASFGVLLASIVTSRKQADGLSTLLILFMSAIGGSMIPFYFMPKFMQDAAVVSVNYWSIQGFYDIFWREGGLSAIFDNALTLIAIGIVILMVSLYFFRRNVLKLL